VRITLLGAVECQAPDGSTADLGHPTQRRVFSALALNANEVITTSDLIDRVWDDPPPSARNMMHTYISRLRKALDELGGIPPARLLHRHSGYILEVEPNAVDLDQFRRLVATARTISAQTAASVGLYRKALRIWTGPALSGIPGDWPARVRSRLELERLFTLIECHQGELALGRHMQLVDELYAVADEYPENEIVIRHLMTALYRSGWQAEALKQYQLLRRRLAERFGVDPAPQTQELYERVLCADPALAGTPATAAGPVSPVLCAPRQLPRDTDFVGRERELAALDGFVASTAEAPSPARLIEGPPGIGKTALALHWAHRMAQRFPDGQIFVPLHGSDRRARPLSALEALAFVLRSIGVCVIPEDTNECIQLYRVRTSGQRLLIIFDDAAGLAQVAPMLPGSAAGTIVITTRGTGLEGLEELTAIRRVRLDALTEHQSTRMFATLLGPERVEAEALAVGKIVSLCGRVPRSISTAAERAAMRPHLSLSDLATTLASRY
jgi:DNA-binding SARP family transcriptional activator